ncbi:MAG: Hsp20/alpha crystallin family protein [Candidatus Sericytochromatia bacterium]|uniref:Hsp20/alpha crystallin family protein n=1 Tax=Candidatus Tanganyikabacteria bacterium TaxID=2961651 RepID=A0A938BKS3_9BACT|nr:Hsp20/alpha crystallin family protein [Candidatus Tanganyikabacteria bacterium]
MDPRFRRNISPSLMRSLDEISQMFEQAFGERAATPTGHWLPSADVFETGDTYSISLDLPGVKQEDIRLGIEGNELTLSGERPYQEPAGGKAHKVERSYGSFQRTFQLPVNVNREGIKASLKEGVLTLRLPKKEEVKPKTINIEVDD